MLRNSVRVHVLDQLKESSRVRAAAINEHKRPTKRMNLGKAVPANCPCQVAPGHTLDEGDGGNVFQICYFPVQFTAFNPSFSYRGVRFLLLFAFSSMRSYKHITRFAERMAARVTRPTPHPPPSPSLSLLSGHTV
jgi:hypothetical protein